MNEMQKCFLDKCSNHNTTLASFIRLFNLWTRLSSDERGELIDYEIEKGRLEVKQ